MRAPRLSFLPSLCVVFLGVTTTTRGDLEDFVFAESTYQNLDPADVWDYPANTITPGRGGAVFFTNGGNVNNASSAPGLGGRAQGNVRLVQSAVGAMTPTRWAWVMPDGSNAADYHKAKGLEVIDEVTQIYDALYKTDAADPDAILFSMKLDPAGDVPDLPVNNATQADAAELDFFIALRINPNDRDAIDGLLDVTFQRSLVFIILGNLFLEKAFTVRFDEMIHDPGRSVIDDEISVLGFDKDETDYRNRSEENAWTQFHNASQVWAGLFDEPVFLDIWLENAELRSFSNTAQAFGEDGQPVFDGFKDITVMLRAMSLRARAVQEIARRLALLLQRQMASDLAEQFARRVVLEEAILFQLFFPNGLPEDHEEKFPGLAEAFLELRIAMESLRQTRDLANNERLNVLGIDRDLIFIKPGSENSFIYTYDFLRNQLLSEAQNPIGVLDQAFDADEAAKQTRRLFELKRTEYISQFDALTEEYNRQLVELCGELPDQAGIPDLETPELRNGLIAQQILNVQKAANNISRVRTHMSNVIARIEIERERVWKVKGINNRRAEMVIDFGNRQANITEEIGNIQAEMALANGLAAAAAAFDLEKGPTLHRLKAVDSTCD